jgi:hypothetical protein
MNAHEVDDIGLPLDPELRELEFHLGNLAAMWRGSKGMPERRREIVKEYHDTMAKLYSLGWDAILDIDCELPDELMPEEYLRRHPTLTFSWEGSRNKKADDDKNG